MTEAALGPYTAFDRLADIVARTAGSETAARVRRDFSARRGEVFDDEALWELTSQTFLEWFVLESRETPADPPRGFVAAAALGDDAERAGALAWLHSHRSLFEVLAVGNGRVDLRDAIGGAVFSVSEARALHGVGRGDCIEARLVASGDDVVFGRGFVFHPPAANAVIGEACARAAASGADRLAVLDVLARLRIRCERYRHLGVTEVYRRGVAESGLWS